MAHKTSRCSKSPTRFSNGSCSLSFWRAGRRICFWLRPKAALSYYIEATDPNHELFWSGAIEKNRPSLCIDRKGATSSHPSDKP
jgi:hypothetical protein